jgi:hypothetical protein
MLKLTAIEARRLRWQAQLLGGSDLEPAAVVDRAVAMQGQEVTSVLRAIAMRSQSGTTLANVRAAFDDGRLVRSWPMRGTLFATTPEHLATLLHFTAERTHRSTTRRRGELGLHDDVLLTAREVIAEALEDGPLSRADALALLQKAGINTDEGRRYHLLFHLCVDGLAHWGPFNDAGSDQLLIRSVTPPPADPEAALARIARGYVAARGPVTDADFAWWTKLPKSVARRALSAVDDLVEVEIAGNQAWMVGEPDLPESSGVTLVPGFDEWILGYADRSLVMSPRMFAALVPGGNGIFRPAVLVDGVVVATWRLSRASRTKSVPELTLVEDVSSATRAAIDRALEAWPYG